MAISARRIRSSCGRFYNDFDSVVQALDATIPVATQVGFRAGTESATTYVPSNYSEENPIGIHIHINPNEGSGLPAQFNSVMRSSYCIAVPKS
ncbi:hypothetical protein [Haloferula sp.]|uniref:hypothetical protein n=1 Tax=Haloferula sp. TaxID=2497595 RepID=UPI003C79058A